MTPEIQLIERLLALLIITGFITGIFISGAAFKICEFAYKVWRLYRFKTRRKNYLRELK